MSKNLYTELRDRHSKELDNFPIMFAFSKEQFNEGMTKLGLNITDTDKIYSIGGGGYVKKTDSALLGAMGKRHKKEMNESIENDKTGEGFIYDMFYYELNNHEYCYTGDIEDTINSLDLTIEQINENEILRKTLKRACKDAQSEDNEQEA